MTEPFTYSYLQPKQNFSLAEDSIVHSFGRNHALLQPHSSTPMASPAGTHNYSFLSQPGGELYDWSTSSTGDFGGRRANELCCQAYFNEGEVIPCAESDVYQFKAYTYPYNREKNEMLRKTICGFLNNRGGHIFIGIEQNTDTKQHRAVGGTYSEALKEQILKVIRQNAESIEPDILINCKLKVSFVPVKSSVYPYTYIPGRYIIKIAVSPGVGDELYTVRNEEGEHMVCTRTENEVLTLDVRKHVRRVLSIQKQRAQHPMGHPRKLHKYDCKKPEEGFRLFEGTGLRRRGARLTGEDNDQARQGAQCPRVAQVVVGSEVAKNSRQKDSSNVGKCYINSEQTQVEIVGSRFLDGSVLMKQEHVPEQINLSTEIHVTKKVKERKKKAKTTIKQSKVQANKVIQPEGNILHLLNQQKDNTPGHSSRKQSKKDQDTKNNSVAHQNKGSQSKGLNLSYYQQKEPLVPKNLSIYVNQVPPNPETRYSSLPKKANQPIFGSWPAETIQVSMSESKRGRNTKVSIKETAVSKNYQLSKKHQEKGIYFQGYLHKYRHQNLNNLGRLDDLANELRRVTTPNHCYWVFEGLSQRRLKQIKKTFAKAGEKQYYQFEGLIMYRFKQQKSEKYLKQLLQIQSKKNEQNQGSGSFKNGLGQRRVFKLGTKLQIQIEDKALKRVNHRLEGLAQPANSRKTKSSQKGSLNVRLGGLNLRQYEFSNLYYALVGYLELINEVAPVNLVFLIV